MEKPAFDPEALSTEERLELIERLWESLRSNPNELPLTASQRDELDRRLDELSRTPAKGVPWEGAIARIRDRRDRSG